MDLLLKEKAAVVLAASSGLGRSVATELVREGAQVMLVSSNEDRLMATQRHIEQETGVQPACFVANLEKQGAAAQAVEAAVARFGRLDVLVTNAPGPRSGPFELLTPEDWQSAFQLSLFAHVEAIQAALPHMQRQGGGRILCVTSASVKQALDNLVLSNSLRLAVVGMVKTLSREVAKDGILVNVIGSGPMETPRMEALDTQNAERAGVTFQAWRQRQSAQIPMGRYGQPQEFGRLAAFLCSGMNTYLTGQAIVIDGAMTAAY